MSAATGIVAVDGFVNLLTAAKALGYAGGGRVRMLIIDNINAGAVYVHFINSNSSSGLTGTDGIKLSGGAFPEQRMLQLGGAESGDVPDLAHTFLFTTGGSVNIKIAVFGN
jgi:hypothetical protein